MRIISFSADGLREAAELGFYDWVARQDADFVCIQDMRCSEYDLQEEVFFPRDLNGYFFDDVDGRENGVALYCRQLPKAIMTGLGFAEFDMQGRYIQADYETLSVGCLLAPLATEDDEASQASKDHFFELLGAHLQKIRNKRRNFILCGNWRIAHSAADVQNSAANSARPGFLPEERQWMDELLENGYVDAFRQISTDTDAFTYWPGERGEDGWRIDMQIVSEDLRYTVEHGAFYTGASFSRHAPLIMDYDLEL